MRGFVERNVAKTMTCKSQLAAAVRDLLTNPGRSMSTIQTTIVSYFDSHQVSKFIGYAMVAGSLHTHTHIYFRRLRARRPETGPPSRPTAAATSWPPRWP